MCRNQFFIYKYIMSLIFFGGVDTQLNICYVWSKNVGLLVKTLFH